MFDVQLIELVLVATPKAIFGMTLKLNRLIWSGRKKRDISPDLSFETERNKRIASWGENRIAGFTWDNRCEIGNLIKMILIKWLQGLN